MNIDLRMMIYTIPLDTWSECVYDDIAYNGQAKVCYTPEALCWADGAHLINNVFSQVATGLLFRTITVSIFEHVMDNWHVNSAFVIQCALQAIIAYVPGLNYGFGTRPLRIEFWFPCAGGFILIVLYGEFTKWLVRRSKNSDDSGGFFFKYLKI